MHLMIRAPHTALLSVLLTVCAIIYLPGLQGDFVYDDYANLIYDAAFDDPKTVTLGRVIAENTSGPTGRPLSMASFYFSYKFADGFDAASFKAVGIAIHLINGVLLYLLAARLLPSGAQHGTSGKTWALIITAIWLLHPLHVSTVMYVVQRMTLLATVFMLLGLLTYTVGRERIANRLPRGNLYLAISLACMPAALLSKEIGILQGVLALTLEWFILRHHQPLHRRNTIYGYFGITIILPGLMFAAALAAGKTNFFGYGGRPFTLVERLMTEPRVVLNYAQWILVPNVQQYGLYHDDIELSTGLFAPRTTFLAIASLALIGLGVWLARLRWPLIAGGVAFFFAGHTLESTALPLLIAFEHRNYLPSAGLIIATVTLFRYFRAPNQRRWLLSALTGMVILALAFATMTRAMNWGNPLAQALSETSSHPSSAQAHAQASTVYNAIVTFSSLDSDQLQQYAQSSLEHLEVASRLNPESSVYRIGILWIRSRFFAPPSDAEIKTLSSFLKGMTPEPAIGWHIKSLIDCGALVNGGCNIELNALRKLANGALSNPRVGGNNRASILIGLATVEHEAGNRNKAIEAIRQAVDASQLKIPFQITLAQYLSDIGSKESALEVFKAIQASNRAWIYQADIESLADKMNIVQ